MNRKGFVASAAGLGVGLPLAAVAFGRTSDAPSALPERPLTVPADGIVRTAFAIGPGVNVIDTAGPWEVLQDAAVYGGAASFDLYTVAENAATVEASGGLAIEPTYSYDTAPTPQVVVVPAHGSSERTVRWIRDVSRRADLVMSVCTGAFVLAETGLLDGKSATTHHQSWDDLASSFPAVCVVRGSRFVEHDRVATAGGLTSGIDLALRVVERYLGRDAAIATAQYMEYERR